MATTTVQIDSELLEQLRERHPGRDDRTLIEDLARVELGFAALHASQIRNGLDDEVATESAVRAVHEARRVSR